MKQIHLFYIFIFSIPLLFSSCASRKQIQYFQDIDTVGSLNATNPIEPKIQVGDLLYINITATNAEAALPFNLYETPPIGQTITAAKPMPYLVDAEGRINFPVLGKLQITGLNTKELTQKLELELTEYIKNPVINIRFANFRVSVLGEVNRPGTFPVSNEHMSVIEAISLAGDLTIYGKRESVLLIRTENGKKQYINLNLTKKDLLESPYFYVKQNDIIYVNPNKTRVNAAAVGPNTGVIISSVSILITVLALIFN